MSNPRRTLATVNKAIEAAGIPCELVKGKGYFYFVGESVNTEPGVYVNALNELSVEQWIDEARERQIVAVEAVPAIEAPQAPEPSTTEQVAPVVKSVCVKANRYSDNVVHAWMGDKRKSVQNKPKRRASKLRHFAKLLKYIARAA